MKSYLDLLALSTTAAAPINARKFVGFDGQHAGADAPVFGVAQTDQVAGREVTCTVLGIGVLKAEGPIAKGAKVVSSADGDAAAAAGGAVNVAGRALEAVADGEFVRVLLGR